MADISIEVDLDGFAQAKAQLEELQDELRELGGITGRVTTRQQTIGKEVRKTGKEMNFLGRTVKTLSRNFFRLSGRFRVLGAVGGTLTATIVGLRTEIAALGAAAGGAAVQVGLRSARERIKSVSDTSQEARERLQSLQEEIEAAGANFISVSGAAGKFAAAMDQAGFSSREAERVIRDFVQAQVDLGVSSSDAASNLEDLTEIVKQGKVELGGLRDALEFTNDPVKVLAQSFDSTQQEIRQFIEDGRTLSASVLPVITEQLRVNSQAVDGLAPAFNRLVSTVIDLLETFNRAGAIDAMTSSIRRLNRMLQTSEVSEFFRMLSQRASELIRSLPGLAKSIVTNWEKVLTVLRGVAGALIGGAAGGIPGSVIGAIAGANDKVRKFVLDGLAKLLSFGKDVLLFLGNFEENVSDTAKAVGEFIQNIIDFVKNKFGPALAKAAEKPAQAFRDFKDKMVDLFSEIFASAMKKAFNSVVPDFNLIPNYRSEEVRDRLLGRSGGEKDGDVLSIDINKGQRSFFQGTSPFFEETRVPRMFLPQISGEAQEVAGRRIQAIERTQPTSLPLKDIGAQAEKTAESMEALNVKGVTAQERFDTLRGKFERGEISLAEYEGRVQAVKQRFGELTGRANVVRRPLDQVDATFRNLTRNAGRFGEAIRKQLIRPSRTLKDVAQRAAVVIRDSFSRMFESLISGSESFGDAVKNAFQSMVDFAIQQLARLATNQMFRMLLGGGRGGGFSLGGLFGRRGVGGGLGLGGLTSTAQAAGGGMPGGGGLFGSAGRGISSLFGGGGAAAGGAGASAGTGFAGVSGAAGTPAGPPASAAGSTSALGVAGSALGAGAIGMLGGRLVGGLVPGLNQQGTSLGGGAGAAAGAAIGSIVPGIGTAIGGLIGGVAGGGLGGLLGGSSTDRDIGFDVAFLQKAKQLKDKGGGIQRFPTPLGPVAVRSTDPTPPVSPSPVFRRVGRSAQQQVAGLIQQLRSSLDPRTFERLMQALQNQGGFQFTSGEFRVNNSRPAINSLISRFPDNFVDLASQTLRGLGGAGQIPNLRNTLSFQTGGSAVVTEPTLMSVGERGPEQVDVDPLATGRRGAEGRTVNINGPVLLDEIGVNRFQRKLSEEMRREEKRVLA